MFALGCAVARAFSLYTRKNFLSIRKQSTITVEFCFKGEHTGPPTDADISCLAAAADGIRLAAQIVDMPCNEMHTDAFVQVPCSSCFHLECVETLILNKNWKCQNVLQTD
jgi:probable aminopeptidase NPEPL1